MGQFRGRSARFQGNVFGAQGLQGTTDTRIFNPELNVLFHEVDSEQNVKPAAKHQRLSRCLSNPSTGQPDQRKTAEGAATHLNGNANLSSQSAYQDDSLTAIAGGEAMARKMDDATLEQAADALRNFAQRENDHISRAGEVR
jgi:hypothetical protein